MKTRRRKIFNSQKYQLEVGKKGFTLWERGANGVRGRWLLDASCLLEDDQVRLSDDAIRRLVSAFKGTK